MPRYTEEDIIIGYKDTISKENSGKFTKIVKDFLGKLGGLKSVISPGFPTLMEAVSIPKFLKRKRKSEKNFMRLKFSSLYEMNIDKNREDKPLILGNDKSNYHKGGIYWNLDPKMKWEGWKGLMNDTIHSEISLISDFRNRDFQGITKDSLLCMVLSTRPCINCAKAISKFNEEIKHINGKGISHIFLARNDLYLDNPVPTELSMKYKTQEFQVVLEKLLNAGMRVYIYANTSERKYMKHKECEYFYDLFLGNAKCTKSLIKNIDIRELSYEHITEMHKSKLLAK